MVCDRELAASLPPRRGGRMQAPSPPCSQHLDAKVMGSVQELAERTLEHDVP